MTNSWSSDLMSNSDLDGNGPYLSLDLAELLDPKVNDDLLESLQSRTSLSSDMILSELDTEIAAKSRRLVGVRTIRNAMLPIFTLPTELLSRIIFESVIDSAWPDDIYWMQWLRLMKVCRRFMDVVLSTHALWSYIAIPARGTGDHFSSKRVRLYAQRAGTLPLTVKLKLFAESINIGLAYLSAECSVLAPERIGNLDMEGKALILKPRLSDLADKVYPNLESLHVKAVDTDNTQESLPLTLPDSVFSGGTPRLRSLKLENVIANFGSVNNLSELTLLFDMNNPATHGPSYTFSAIISMLTRSPNLTSVDIFLPWFSSSGFENFGRIPLPKLESLRLKGDVLDCNEMLRALLLPPTATLGIYPQRLYCGVDSRSLMLRLREHYRGYLQDASGTDIGFLNLVGSGQHFTVGAHASADNATVKCSMWDDCSCCLRLNSHPDREVFRRQILSRLIDALPTAHLTRLDVSSSSEGIITASTWKLLLLRLPSLQKIVVCASESHFVSLASTLVTCLDRGVTLPSLNLVKVKGTSRLLDTDRLRYSDKEAARVLKNGACGLKLLIEYLSRRKPLLPTLELTDCSYLTKDRSVTNALGAASQNLSLTGRYSKEAFPTIMRMRARYVLSSCR